MSRGRVGDRTIRDALKVVIEDQWNGFEPVQYSKLQELTKEFMLGNGDLHIMAMLHEL